MFEHNKLPYNKHALKVLLGKQDELIKHFYALDKPINNKLIQYNDRISRTLNKNSISGSLGTIKNTTIVASAYCVFQIA